jgi:hypothetical protein
MSTPGKVLVVLTLLVVPAWIVMLSAVAQLNKNAGQQVEDLKKQVQNLENDVVATRKAVVRLKDDISLEQEAMTNQLAVLRSHVADLHKARSEWIEIATRGGFDVASMQEAAKRATTTRDLRVAEKMQEDTALHAAEAEVQKLMQEHAQLSQQLDSLRGNFKAALTTNRKLLDQLKAKKPS